MAGSITDAGTLKLDGARGIAIFNSTGGTYAAVTGYVDDGVQILDVSDPSSITAAGSIADGDGALRLQAPRGIAIFESGGSTYAAVSSFIDNGVQILDVSDPYSVTAAGRIGDNNARVLGGAWDIATFTSGGSTYAAVAALEDDGVQIIRIDDDLAAVQPPEGSFITTWQTTTVNEPITIPVGGATGNYTVDWGDGSSTTHITDAEHTYAAAGEYTVSISGDFTEIKLYPDDTNAEKLKSIKQWGSISWTTMEEAFRGASNMAYDATDTPDLSGVTSMTSMFHGTSFNGDLSAWNVSAVTDTRRMFQSTYFNGDLSAWDVSSVTDMNGMFFSATVFNRPLNTWDVSSVTNMNSMFFSATVFNQHLNTWNVSSVTNMNHMFAVFPGSSSFNGNISSWDVSSVTDMNGMFRGASSFNHPLNTWNVSSVTDMNGMFRGASSFNHPLNTWNVSSVTDMSGMFEGATSFGQNLGNWYVTLSSTSIDSSDTPGVVGSISAQNQPLRDHDPAYGIGDGPDSGSFEIDAGTLRMSLADAAPGTYTANITAAGDAVFVNGNNWRAVQVNVTGAASVPPEVGAGLNLTAADSITDTFTLNLRGLWGIATFTSGGSTYAAVAASSDDGVQILNVTDPHNVTAAGKIADDDALALDSARDITTFTSGGSTYAAVAAFEDDGVQILDITDPHNVTAAGSIADDDALALDGAHGIATFTSGGRTYAAVAASVDDGVQILDVTDPSAITAAGSITDSSDAPELNQAYGIAIFNSTGGTYAAVSALSDDGVQILNVTDPSSITAAGSIANNGTLLLNGARGIATFTSGGSTYAAVAASSDDGVQILNVTDPHNVTAAGKIADDDALALDSAQDITTFTSGGSTYAAVASSVDDGVQILDVTDPSAITAAGSITDDDDLALNGARGITTFTSGGSTYAAVAGSIDHGVQIIRLTGDAPQVVPNSSPTADAGPDLTFIENSTFTLAGSATDPDDDALMYAWSQDPPDSGVTFDDDTSLAPTVTLPPVAADTTVTLTLEVRDDSSASADSLALTVAEADGSFITTWTTTGADQTITIPVGGHGGTYTAVWGDGGTSAGVTGDTDHGYAEAGTYTVSVSGDFARFHLDGDSDNAPKLASIEQWGDARWISMEGAFRGAANVEYKAADAPDLSGVTSMKTMFIRASSFNGDLSSWDVSRVEDMEQMFESSYSFNGDLSSWDVSRVTDMRGMFLIASAFNQDISSWDVSRVTDMRGMFLGASAFNRDISIWNVSGVEGMESMFGAPSSFDQNLGRWYVVPADASFDAADTSLNVTTISAQNAFLDGHNPAYGIGSGHNSTLFNMTGSTLMFKGAPDPGDYMVSVTASGGGVFSSGNNWRVLNVTVTDQDGGTSPDGAFVTTWDPIFSPYTVSIPLKVHSGGTLSIDWGDGNTTTVTSNGTQSHTYAAPGKYQVSMTGDLARINLGAAGSTADTLTSIDSWGNVGWSGMKDAFRGAFRMASNATDAPDLSGVTDMSGMFRDAASFDQPLADWNVSSVTDMSYMFQGDTSFDQPLADWNVSSVTDMSNMFSFATSFDQPLAAWDVSSVTDMSGMFEEATSFNQPLADWNVSSVTDMSGMFRDAASFDQPLADWNVSSVTDMSGMFEEATSFNQPLADWNVSSVTDMSGMFNTARDFNQPLADWNVSSVTDMSGMFNSIRSFNQPLADWNVSSVTDMSYMFQGDTSFDQPLADWNVSSVTDMS